MQLDEQEKAKLDQEWKKMGGMGRDLARKRAIATLASIAVALPFFIVGIAGMAIVSIRAMLLVFPGIILGAIVRKSLWPRSQFG